MLMPKRVKRRRQFRGRMKGRAGRGNTIAYGEFGLMATECGWVTSNQIEAARIAMTRFIKRGGQVWISIFPHKPVTKKPAETRMGSGKGSPEYWVAVVKPDRILFEMAGIAEDQAREAMRLASHKLPIKTKFVTKADFIEKDEAAAAPKKEGAAAEKAAKPPAPKTEVKPIAKETPKAEKAAGTPAAKNNKEGAAE